MSRKLQFKRGTKAKLPVLSEGEPGWVTDEGKLYMGTGGGNIPMAREDHTHTAEQVGALPLSGGRMTGDLDMGAHGLTDVGRIRFRDTSTALLDFGVDMAMMDKQGRLYFNLEGSIAAHQDMHMTSHRISGVASPVEAGDTANKEYVDTGLAGKAAVVHGHTADQVGADPAGSAAGVQNSLNAFAARRDNPNGVTAAQTGAYTKAEADGMVAAALPRGIITMWSGSAGNIPGGWALCNGQNGTPNLLDRFIVGAGSGYAPGAVGGAAAVALDVSHMPAHSHSASLSGLGVSGAGEHSHEVTALWNGEPKNLGCMITGSMGTNGIGVKDGAVSSVTAKSAGAHTHTVTGSIEIGPAGAGGAHENRPPYYALCFIMKL